MIRLRFEPTGYETDVVAGARVVDVTDVHPYAGVPYACRGATCATCRVEVIEGLDALDAAEADELETLAVFGSPPAVRLACQIRILRDVPRVTLRVVGAKLRR